MIRGPTICSIFELNDAIKNKGYKIKGSQLKKVIDKLERDKHIHKSTQAEINKAGVKIIQDYFNITFEGEALIEIENGYSGRFEKDNREKESIRFNKIMTITLTAIGTIIALLVFLFQVLTYEDPTKIENLEYRNRLISKEKEQIEELYRQSIYKENRSRYSEELLRDSLRKAK